MKQLIVHIEYDPNEVREEMLLTNIDSCLSALALDGGYSTKDEVAAGCAEDIDIGWRYFDSLNEACGWEDGIPTD